MSTWLLVAGAFSLGVGLERGWLPGVGVPFWVHLILGSAAVAVGLALEMRAAGASCR